MIQIARGTTTPAFTVGWDGFGEFIQICCCRPSGAPRSRKMICNSKSKDSLHQTSGSDHLGGGDITSLGGEGQATGDRTHIYIYIYIYISEHVHIT